jgi:hypothetical protein
MPLRSLQVDVLPQDTHQVNLPGACPSICCAGLGASALLLATACAAADQGKKVSPPPRWTVRATKGQSDWKIVLPPNASGPETLAADELAKYIRAMAKADLPILKESSPGTHTIAIDSAAGALDGFDLAVTTDRITIHGHTSRGTV